MYVFSVLQLQGAVFLQDWIGSKLNPVLVGEQFGDVDIVT